MGQYYYGVLLNKKDKNEVLAANYQAKLTESGLIDFLLFCYALSSKGKYAHSRVVWTGDYSKKTFAGFTNLYHMIQENQCGDNPKIPFIDCDKKLTLLKGYLCNHTRKEYVDIEKVKQKYRGDNDLNPLALLCSDPTCRCLGGGDYFIREGFDMVSLWYNHELSTESSIPNGYKELELPFLQTETGTPVWRYENMHQIWFDKADFTYWGVFVNFENWLTATEGISWRNKNAEELKKNFQNFSKFINEQEAQKVYKEFMQELEASGHKASPSIKVIKKNGFSFVDYHEYSFLIEVKEDLILFEKPYFHHKGISYDIKNGKIRYHYLKEFKKLLRAIAN